MARNLWADETAFFRALVEELVDGEWKAVAAYGPYTAKNQCQDRSKHLNSVEAKYMAGTRRKRVQKQVAKVHTLSDGGYTIGIEWEDV